jgi:hypothetical protein
VQEDLVRYHRDDWIQVLYFQEMVMLKPKEIRDDQYSRSKQENVCGHDGDRELPKKMQT